jgi:hypothetical protein
MNPEPRIWEPLNWATAPSKEVRARLLEVIEDAIDPPFHPRRPPLEIDDFDRFMASRKALLGDADIRIDFLTTDASRRSIPLGIPPRILAGQPKQTAAEFIAMVDLELGRAADVIQRELGQAAGVTLAVTLKWHGDPNEAPLKEWLVDRTLSKVGTALLAGQWGVYKTFVAFDLAAAVMTVTPFAGRAVNRQGGVLFIACEGQDEVPVRLEGIARERVALLPVREGVVTVDPAHMPFVWVETCLPLAGANAAGEISAIVEAAQAVMLDRFGLPIALIMIDTMTAAADFKDASATAEAQRVMKALGKVALKQDALVLAVDHFGKDASVGVRDSSAKEGSGDSVLAILANRDIEGNVTKPRLAIRKVRGAPTDEVIPFTTRSVVIDEGDGDNAITTLIIEWLPTEAGDETQLAGGGKQWPKALAIFMKALDFTLADTGQRIRPFVDGPEVLGAQRDSARAEFRKSYPADNQKAKDMAFTRCELRAVADDLMASRPVDGVTFFWRL